MSHACVLVALDSVENGSVEEAVEKQMKRFGEYENGGWFADGSRHDAWGIGNRFSDLFVDSPIATVGEIRARREEIAAYRLKQREENWCRAMEKENDPYIRSLCYGIKNGQSKKDYCKLAHWFPASYAFLRNREWHEKARMGWFGVTAPTECEIASPEHEGRCIHERPDGARIIVWGEAEWEERFYARFVSRLEDSVTLVAVDYHV